MFFASAALLMLPLTAAKSQKLDSLFLNPPQQARPLMIWQWMDGVVSEKGITADLAAYREAGIGGVQQFHVGGPVQGYICDTANAVGSDNWRRLMRHAIAECRRLGLSFGTHNCPGWSSSAYPTVEPEYSMQNVVWAETKADGGQRLTVTIARPAVSARWNFYRDIAVLAMPDSATIMRKDIIDLTERMDDNGTLTAELPEGRWRIIRFGRTTTGQTNYGTAPYGGVGLECDKLSREAVRRYWETYPRILLDIAGKEAGKTFSRIEIDSYEAGGQSWSPVLPEEFRARRGYDITPWLPAYAGVTVESRELTDRFWNDLRETVTDLCAENYYGYMGTLAHQTPGLSLLYQPYGTGGAKPFSPVNTGKIVAGLKNDLICAEFWAHPDWGWKDVPRVVDAARRNGVRLIYAEGFTCWPVDAWKDDPASLKAIADRAFCLGINALMLHAGAQNPWPGAVPGMTFGQWGTQFTPGQTWWRSGGAKLLFGYFARCQALLQNGQFADDFRSRDGSLRTDNNALQWTHRRDGEADVYFVANTLDSAIRATVTVPAERRLPETWFPEDGTMGEAEAWSAEDGLARVALDMRPHQSVFIVLRGKADGNGPGLVTDAPEVKKTVDLDGEWTLHFPKGWGAPERITLDRLTPWNEHADSGVRYFSGSARYTKTIRTGKPGKNERYVLELGEVRNLAKVYVNGKMYAHLWKKPFTCDITEALRKGDNKLEIEVTNLWPNRMIGDEQHPDDTEWSEPFSYPHAPGKPVVGRFMRAVPGWLAKGLPRPSAERKTVVSFKFFRKDSALMPSGLIGPVKMRIVKAGSKERK